MRTLINWLRQVFCKHDWLVEEKNFRVQYMHPFDFQPVGDYSDQTRVSLTCKKCQWHKYYKKWG